MFLKILYESSSEDSSEEDNRKNGNNRGSNKNSSDGLLDLEDIGPMMNKMKKAKVRYAMSVLH